MYVRPTTEQVLLGVARDLQEQVLPHVAHDPARVALGMIDQLLRQCARRAAHEIAWAREETAAVVAAVAELSLGGEPAVADALAALEDGPQDSLHLDDVVERYDRTSRVLSAGLEAAYRRGDTERIGMLRQLLAERTAREQEIIGALDLVGRG